MRRDPDTIETAPEPEADGAPAARSDRPVGFVVLWNRERAEHAGAWLDLGALSHGVRLLGRGPSRADDEHVRLLPVHARAGAVAPCSPFRNASISRTQLIVRRVEAGVLELTNVGQCRLTVNGVERRETRVRPGDVLEVGAQLVLLCAERAPLTASPVRPPTHPFGAADADGFVGESPAAWSLRHELAFVARREGHVILFGATGTGKELAAQALHGASGRTGPLVSRNAATFPATLVDAELFGNPKGYPNPGMLDRKGLIGAADEGTLFLDEFAELPTEAQAHLLRALDSGEYQRLGETAIRQSSFRLIAATNRPESALRTDLLARFDFRVRLPTLAERREDLPLLARHLLSVMAESDPEIQARCFDQGVPRFRSSFVRRMVVHDYVANVRELRQYLWRSVRESKDGTLDWPRDTPSAPTSGDPEAQSIPPETARLGPAELRSVLDANNGSIEKSWRVLGLSSRYALVRLLRKHSVVVTKKLRSS